MKRFFAAAGAAALLVAATPLHAAQSAQSAARSAAPPTAAAAAAFVAKAESELARLNQYASRAAWVRATYITEDTMWLEAKANAELTNLQVRSAVEAARYDKTAADPVVRRKLELLKRNIVMPAPGRPGAADEMAGLESKLDSAYSTGKFVYQGKTLTLDEMSDILARSRDPSELKAVWEGWAKVAPPMRGDYAKLIALANQGARELGYKDAGALWRSGYDMDPDAFAAKVDKVWAQVAPFYSNLHCYVRGRLNDKYGDAVQPRKGPIRADLLGNMWSQQWANIYDIAAPRNGALGYDLEQQLKAQNYDAVRMMKTAENFYTSLGFDPMPQTFWERSMITRPRDREVVCHASAWDIDDARDIRIKMCTKINADDFFTVHHEMGHNIYQRAYAGQPFLFKNGANDGFHEAIGDFAGLNALSPNYLKQVGLIDQVPGEDAEIPYLLRMAMDRIAFLPFGLLIDKWRWQVFSGEVTPDHYNDAWWALRTRYQGIAPPGPRPADAFDPGAKYHVAASVPYMRYFLAYIYEFQFYRAACRQAGWKGPLDRCTVYMNKDVGRRFNAMMAMGQSKPWPEALAAFTGEKDIDASAITDYFAPLNAWLIKQNQGETCGW
jgi:peptidyl-dipeptidase A